MRQEYIVTENMDITHEMVNIFEGKDAYITSPTFLLENKIDGLHLIIINQDMGTLPSLKLMPLMKLGLDAANIKIINGKSYILASIPFQDYVRSSVSQVEFKKLHDNVAINRSISITPEFYSLEFYICKDIIKNLLAPLESNIKFLTTTTVSSFFGLIKNEITYEYIFKYKLDFNSDNLGSVTKGYVFLKNFGQEECHVYIDKNKCNFNITSLVKCCVLMTKIILNSPITRYYVRKRFLLEKTFFAMIELITKSYSTDAIFVNEISIEEVCMQTYNTLKLMDIECQKEIKLMYELEKDTLSYDDLRLYTNISTQEVYQNCKLIQAYLQESISATDKLLKD